MNRWYPMWPKAFKEMDQLIQEVDVCMLLTVASMHIWYVYKFDNN